MATKQRPPAPSSTRRMRLWLLAGGVAAAALILAVVLSAGDEGDDVAAEVTVTGEALPLFDATVPAAAAGMTAPEVEGRDFDGDPVAIEAGGTPQAIVFLTHW